MSHLRRMFDEVWVLPVYTHAFESKHNTMAPYEHRKAMCELAFGVAHLTAKQRRNEKVKVLDVERAVVRAAWDRHAVAEEEAKRQRADARGRARGGSPKKDASPGGMGSPTLDRANSGASSSLTPGADDSSAPSSPKTPKTPMTPTHTSSSRLSPFKSPNGPAAAGNPAVPPPKVGSFDVLTAVREANPFASFSWCLGADTFADLRRGKWVNGAEFAALCTQLYVVPRLGGSDAAWVEIQEAATEDEEEIKALLGAGSERRRDADAVFIGERRFAVDPRGERERDGDPWDEPGRVEHGGEGRVAAAGIERTGGRVSGRFGSTAQRGYGSVAGRGDAGDGGE